MVLVVCGIVAVTAGAFLWVAYRIHPYVGTFAECLMTYQILAVKCLKVESMKVYQSLKDENVEQARTAVSMIVGRDTDKLDEEGIAKAAIETVAENTSDGEIGPPRFWMAIGGAPLALAYKAVNTMDSMVGYKNERYLHFGRRAAKLDDAVNFVPARLAALLLAAVMVLAACLPELLA